MHAPGTRPPHGAHLSSPRRNNYFYGKLLDVYHFELETNYFNSKRWLLNRLVSGFGVVCGLNVECGPGRDEIVITPGVAIDRWGREIIVPERTQPLRIPPDLLPPAPRPESEGCAAEDRGVHVVLCYHECETDPAPVLTSDCGGPCAPGAIRERYCIDFRPKCLPRPMLECRFVDLITDGQLDRRALVKHISEDCPAPKDDPCIPLANIRLRPGQADEPACCAEDIDITVRPIVYSNDILFDLLLSLLIESPKPRGGKL